MAKVNAKDLTPKELLEQALVPEGEQPYQVLENWVWVRLNEVSDIVTGGTPSKNNNEFYGGSFPFVKPADLDQGRHVNFASEYLTDKGRSVSRIIPSGSTSVCCIGTIGKCGYIEMESTTNQQINTLIPKFNKLFTYYYCNSESFVNELRNLASATTISIVNKGKMSTLPFPLPPLPEQQRIVDSIESLFEKLDQAKGLIQDALDSFENRKAAILHKAFSGELIGAIPSIVELKTIAQEIKIGPFGTMLHAKDYIEGGIPVINPKHIVNQKIFPQDSVTISKEKAEELSKYKLKENDIIMARRGEMGRTAYVSSNENGWLCGTGSVRIRMPEAYSGLLYSRILSSQATVEYLEVNAKGITMKNLNEGIVGQIPVPNFTYIEQEKISIILDDIVAKEQKAEELCDTLDLINSMKKSILARAFRGELGTNDPEEESALKLLGDMLVSHYF